MSNHQKTLVPLYSGCYNSPQLIYDGIHADIGLFAEALIYYEQVYVDPGNPQAFAELVRWFIKQKKIDLLIDLIKYDIIKIYNYNFDIATMQQNSSYSVGNLSLVDKPMDFQETYLRNIYVIKTLDHLSTRRKLFKVCADKTIEVNEAPYNDAINNALKDYNDPIRNALLVQAFADEIYSIFKLGESPEVKVNTENKGTRSIITYNIDFAKLIKQGERLGFYDAAPLAGEAYCNRHIYSASELSCDLYLGSPMSRLVGDKLYEVGVKACKKKTIIEQLNHEVEYPDIRYLVNTGQINIDIIMDFRKKASKFREWLNEEGERDRNAIIAYHNEFSNENHLQKFGKKSLSLLVALGSAGAGAAIGYSVGNAEGAIIGAIAGEGVKFLFDVSSKINVNWKPVIFGNWASDRIKKVLNQKNSL